ncbi:DUF1716-domain-containing protein [Amniculicola lignicola CBS 123094]|uniref:DUF1716-domain-containing protein n=1 Tax=Amniculicola lignicola CBS 123094 TaxID=1392246 RepID=A0A6A5WYF8_9PLEO|nr:DUF1716-domain-containing protein [Amniculicola lignicola CBS 123094]
MTSIDELFKAHSATKRKFDPSELDPSQAYKSLKLSPPSDIDKRSQAFVAEEDEDEAGPALPPDLEDRAVDDDEEGRFFGEGMDENAVEAMDYLDSKDADEAIVDDKFDAAWLRRLCLGLQKKIAKNADLRAKYEDQPSKFMGSEGDLDEAIKALSVLSDHPEHYAQFAQSAGGDLLGLLAHENTDIAIDAIEIISELTDEDVEAEQEQWDALVKPLLEGDFLTLLIANFSRFDEQDEGDRSGVYHSLGVVENLLSQPENTETIGKERKLLSWLIQRIRKPEKPTTQNKAYAAEILSILTQSSTPNRRRVIEASGIDIILTLLAPYRRNDPESESAEEEYVENLFNCLASLVDESEGKDKFMEAEGVELCLMMVKDGKLSKSRSLKVLDHACGYSEPSPPAEAQANGTGSPKDKGKEPLPDPENHAATVCTGLVNAQGLKPLFGTFMKTKQHDPQTTEHILGLFASLLRSLPGYSDARFRILAKFSEKDYAKTIKLVTLRREYATRVAAFDSKIAARKRGLPREEQEEIDVENIPARLDKGLYCLERIDAILAWLVAEDEGAKRAIVKALADRDESLTDVKKTLQAQLVGVLEVDASEREMLETLIGFLS